MRHRRLAVASATVAVVVTAGLALPGSSAYLQDKARNVGSVFGMGEPPAEQTPLESVRGTVCLAVEGAAGCPEDLPSPWPTAEPTPESSATPASPEPRASVDPGPDPGSDPGPNPPADGDARCRDATCADQPVHVVGAFADRLVELRRAEPEQLPEQAVRTVASFADELRAMPEPQDDLPLPEDTRDALGELAEAGALPAFAPACVADVGDLAALIGSQWAREAERDRGASPSPSPTPTCAAGEPRESGGSGDGTGTPTEPSAAPKPGQEPDQEPSPEPNPSPSPTPSDYPYDPPGHRVRSAD